MKIEIHHEDGCTYGYVQSAETPFNWYPHIDGRRLDTTLDGRDVIWQVAREVIAKLSDD